MKILFTGGGSYGHVTPIVSVYPKLKSDGVFTEFYWIGSAKFEEQAAQELDIAYIGIKTAKVRRYMSWKNVTDMFVLFASLFRTLSVLRKIKPDLIFSTGGYVSVPVVLIGKMLGIKIVIHEQTVSFGLANKVGARVAKRILLSDAASLSYLTQSQKNKAIVVGNPINQKLLIPSNLKDFFTFADTHKKLLYITGGSQGSQKINQVIFEVLRELCSTYNVIHQCGVLDYEKAQEYMKTYEGSYIARDFIGNQMAAIYQHAHIVISRSGASTVNVLGVFAVPTVFVPLQPCNNDEQYKNAMKFLQTNTGTIVKQDELSKDTLLHALQKVESSVGVEKRVVQGNDAVVEIVKSLEGVVR